MQARRLMITAATIAVLAAPGALFAQGHGGFGGGGGFGWEGGFGDGGFGGHHGSGGFGLQRLERMLPRIADKLGLTEDQQTKIQATIDETLSATEGLRQELDETVDEYRAAHEPRQFDEDEFRSFLQKMAPVKIDLAVADAGAMHYIFSEILTDEQREMLEGFKGMMGGRGPRRSGGQSGS